MNQKQKKFHKKNTGRISNQVARFPDYHDPISRRKIIDFLNQFKTEHMDLGLKVIEKVNYFSHVRTTKQLRLLVSLLNGTMNIQDKNVIFCSMSLSAGKSSDHIIKKIRDIAGMDNKKFDNKFLFLRDLEGLKNDNVHKKIIFADDFIGSGGTVNNLWQVLQNWHNTNHEYYLAIIIGYKNTIDDIEANTPFRVIHAEQPIEEHEKVFHTDNTNFNRSDQRILKKYCACVETRKEFQYGYGNSQSLIVFYENTPNNTIPILHHCATRWTALFPRLE